MYAADPANHRGDGMGLIDKASGKAKQVAGDLLDDPELHRKGKLDERKGEAKEELAEEDARAQRKADEVADLERRSSR
jgi:uncharacterized protein YjbJ (UPF0337 family)